MGGLWRSVAETTRPICEVAADAGRRPTRRSRWCRRCTRRCSRSGWPAPDPTQAGVERAARRRVRQRRRRASSGARSRPSRAAAATSPARRRVADARRRRPSGPCPAPRYRVTGDKHFGSGSGVTSTSWSRPRSRTASDAPTIFVLDVRDRPWDGIGGHAADSPSGTAWAWPRPRATPCASTACPPCAWRGTARSRSSRRAAGAARRQRCSPRSSSACSTRRSPPPAAARGRRPTSCAPTSRSSGPAPSWTTGWPCRRTRARCGPSRRATRPARCTPRCGPRRRSPSWPSRRCCASPG